MTTEAAVAANGLTKSFAVGFGRRRLVAVDDVSLNVARGEVFGLLGPNGSGKSTTLKMLLGLVAPTAGRAEIFGRDTAEVASRASVGFLPENAYFYRFLTGRETLRFYGRLCRLADSDLEKRIDELLDLVGLTRAGDQRLHGYSKGMLQRIGLAQALINDPKLVVLDEPTAGLDPAGSRDMRDLIRDLRGRGATVLLSSHLLEQVQDVCDRVGILANGRLVQEGRLEELLAIDNRTELVLENATPETLNAIIEVAQRGQAKVVEQRRSRTTLERFFLSATTQEKNDQ
jgi:ABC-2 type transport system ATP-binding protein